MLRPADGDGAFGLGFFDGEGNARRLELEPLSDEANEPGFFEIEVRRGHLLREHAVGNFRLAGHFDMRVGRMMASIVERDEVSMASDASPRARPDGVKDIVQELTALFCGKPGFGGIPVLWRRGARWQMP